MFWMPCSVASWPGDRDLRQLALLERRDRRVAEAVVGREHAVDLVRGLLQHLLEDRQRLLVVPVGHGLIGDLLPVSGLELRLQHRVVALLEQRRVVVRRRAVEHGHLGALLVAEAVDESLTLELADLLVVERHVVVRVALEREAVVVDDLDALRLGVGRDRRAGAGVEVHEQEHLRAVRDRLLGLLLLGGLVALGVRDGVLHAGRVERLLEERPVDRLPPDRGLGVRQQHGDAAGLLAAAAATAGAALLVAPACGHGHCEGCDAYTERQPVPPEPHGLPPRWIAIGCGARRAARCSDCRRARASAPSTCARSPRTPATTRASSAAGAIAYRPTASRIGIEQKVARLTQVSAHDDRVGVEHVADRGHRAAEHAPGVGDRALAAGVAPVGQPHDLDDAQDLAAAAPEQVGERRPRDVGLEAAAVAAAADRAGLVDQHVADLARHAAAAAVGAAVDDQPGADARGDHHVERVARVAGRAERDLGQRAQVGVVVEVDGQVAEAPAHLGRDGEALPAGEDRGRAHRAAVVVDRARQRHADADDLGVAEAGLREQLVDELGRRVERALGVVVDVLGADRLGEHRAREVRDRRVDAVVPEVDADDGAGRAVQRQQRRRAAGGHAGRRVGVGVLDDEAVGLQVGDEARDGRAREPGDARDLGAARRPAFAQGLDHP